MNDQPLACDAIPAGPKHQAVSSATTPPATVSHFDARPYFEKALQYGVHAGLLDAKKLAEIAADAPKGMVQIARHFGNENLRPDLEKARSRIVNLVSLHLEHTSGGDLKHAAESLRDHSFLSRSKAGSDMLRALLTLPESSHFDSHDEDEPGNDALALRALADWSLKSLSEYRAELAKRTPVRHEKDAAIWLAAELGMELVDLEDAHTHAEAVIRTALLVLSAKHTKMPDWLMFEKMVVALRKKCGSGKTFPSVRSTEADDPRHDAGARPPAFSIVMPKNLPDDFTAVVEAVRRSVVEDLPKIFDPRLSARALFAKHKDDQTPPLFGRYFWVEDIASEIDQHAHSVSKAWDKATSGNSDDGSLLTLFLCVAAGAPKKTMLTEKAATTLIRKIQKADASSAFNPDLALQYILSYAPVQYQDDYVRLWTAFVEEARHTLQSDSVFALRDAQALLRRECNVK